MNRRLRINYYVEPDGPALARRAAQYFAEMIEEAVDDHGRARIAISGGSTPQAAFALLADPNQPWRSRMPWENLEIFWVDERTVAPDHAESNYRMTREALLDHVPLAPEQIHRIEGELEPEVAAARYESELRNSFRLEGAELPRFDLVALGMGDDGHTASLFPHTGAIQELGRLVVANHVPQKDTWRITLTWPVIDHARSDEPFAPPWLHSQVSRSFRARTAQSTLPRPATDLTGWSGDSSYRNPNNCAGYVFSESIKAPNC